MTMRRIAARCAKSYTIDLTVGLVDQASQLSVGTVTISRHLESVCTGKFFQYCVITV